MYTDFTVKIPKIIGFFFILCYNHLSCQCGGIGRRVRLKIVYPKDVRVRFPSLAPIMIIICLLSYQNHIIENFIVERYPKQVIFDKTIKL